MVNVNFQWYRESLFNFKVILFWSWGHLRVKSRSNRSNRVEVVTWKRWDNSAADFIQHVEGLKSRFFFRPTFFLDFLDFQGRSWTAWSKEKNRKCRFASKNFQNNKNDKYLFILSPKFEHVTPTVTPWISRIYLYLMDHPVWHQTQKVGNEKSPKND